MTGDTYTVTVDHPYYGEISHSGTVTELLEWAHEYDHPCDDTTGCDIANMRDGGWLLIATERMFGATECPTLSAVVDALPESAYNRDAVRKEEDEWWAYVSPVTVQCPHCGTYLHGDPESREVPGFCTNCAEGFDPEKVERVG